MKYMFMLNDFNDILTDSICWLYAEYILASIIDIIDNRICFYKLYNDMLNNIEVI